MAQVKGGDKLAAALGAIAKKLERGGTVEVGFLSDATYPDGTRVAMVAAIQDFGAPSRGIPPRPFFRNMVADKSGGWPDAISENLKATGYDVDKTLGQVGEGIKGQLQQSIVDFSGAPLAPATVKRKGSDKQLVDTGHLLASVDYKVTE
jgi:hypothetical protein